MAAYKLYKLIILYMINRVDFPLTNSQLSEFILDQGYTNYFKLQQALAELSVEGFIREEATHSRTFYHITKEGEETLNFFRNDISPAIQADIDGFFRQKQYELKKEVSVRANYYPVSGGEYSVNCQVYEHDMPLIDLTVTVPAEAEAKAIADNWGKKSQEVYALIMQNLL